MIESIKNDWTAALRSGEYPQGRGALRNDTPNGAVFCCLGVLSELAVEAGVIPPVHRTEYGSYYYGDIHSEYSADYSCAILQDAVREWAGISSFVGTIYDAADGVTHDLTVLNDGRWTFEQIADLIDANWESL